MTPANPTRCDRSLACAVAVILLALAIPLALQAQSPATATPAQKSEKMARPEARTDGANEKAAGAKSVAAKRQKLHECGIKWQDEKKAKDLTGKAAYLKFLSACMKS
jgi:hypothetical protein